ncbi:MAG: ABC transporter ATP-binding protein [Deltaproteobacteria bacterium]|nr:ABC transporter ATP-binding protein [Deltaproteobacteria bacterium]MBW2137688.1 ABC transporter ATP-binding protein [Deltaproteobacteria bacterium]
MLELLDVHKTFIHNGLTIEVLKGIDLAIRPRDNMAITGASGVGKSTLLNIMGTLEPPTRGIVRFEGTDIGKMSERDLCKIRNQDIGFVFQFHHLLPEFNAVENTIVPALIAGTGKKKAMAMAKDMLVEVGLEKRLKHRIGELSGGEQQRVAIARALIMGPKLLLADEPTGNLDQRTGDEVADLLLKLNEVRGLALVIATHNQRLAAKMSLRMEIMDGRIQ